MHIKNLFKESSFRNVGCIAILSVLQSLQLLLVLAVFLQFFPHHQTDFITKLFPVYLPEVRPEREMLLFRIFVLMAIGLMSYWVVKYKKDINDVGLGRKYFDYIVFTVTGIFVQLFFVFKILVWGGAAWAQVMLYVSLVGTILGHIFWPELQRLIKTVIQWVNDVKTLPYPLMWDMGFVGILFLLLWPAKLDYVLGRVFVNDQFYHLDGFWFTAAWAHLQGMTLNVDVISQYSVVIPIFLSELLNRTVGFSYVNAYVLTIVLVMAYVMAFYFFLKHWLHSRAIAALGVLLAVKVSFFHWGVAPLVWQFPTATAFRFLPDIIFFFLLWQHVQKQQRRWLWGLAVVTGFACVWTIDVGIYLSAAFMVYVAFVGRRLLLPLILVIGTSAGIFLFIAQPQAFFSSIFWKNMFEHAALFIQGWGALPVTEGLKERQFFAFIVGLSIPIVYVFTLIYIGALCFFKRIDIKKIFIVAICIYGLGLYHYYIHRSGVTSYYAVSIPFVMVVCFWLNEGVGYLPQQWKRLSKCLLAIVMFFALVTSFLFTYYPNIFNLNGFNWQTEADYYHQEFNFEKDAALISRHSTFKQKIPIISSFETRILMQANRAPFFYYSPLMESGLMKEAKVRHSYLLTQERINKTMMQLTTKKPSWIFVEDKIWQARHEKGIGTLLNFVEKHYVVSDKGQYLSAWERRSRE